MNAPNTHELRLQPPLYRLALAQMAGLTETAATRPEAAWLQALRQECQEATLADWLADPATEDAALHALATLLELGPAELVAVAVAAAVEFDPMLGRTLAWLQAPQSSARPTLGLLQTLADELGIGDALSQVVDGPARACGLLHLEEEQRPLPEQSFLVPLPLVLALRGQGGQWPGVRWQAPGQFPEQFPASLQQAAARHAEALGDGRLAIRSGHPREARAAAAQVAAHLGLAAALFEQEPPRGLGPWLHLRGALPVLCAELAPGETRRLPELPGYHGPLLIATGMEGSFEQEGDPVGNWQVPIPLVEERVTLWQAYVSPQTAQVVGSLHRHRPAHIEHLGRAARHQARLDGDVTVAEHHINRAARNGAGGELGTLAQLLPESVEDAALVLPDELRTTLLALHQRCQRREGLADGLGPAARTRYRPGVRALLVGPSGTGKTLAAGWLATRLGLPLYRVDLAAVVSKYIGETEKNLAQLFARAEHLDVMLLFDEADALFGKRTEVKEANDRFANQQTNYLLQRIESFDGLALLTSNHRSRFDSAFTRRLDAIIDFPAPGPEERRALWLAHLGGRNGLLPAELNRIAATCDLAGGHIRNATLTAASACPDAIDYASLCAAITSEYRKLGRPLPAGL